MCRKATSNFAYRKMRIFALEKKPDNYYNEFEC
jgi:hypothetical protein